MQHLLRAAAPRAAALPALVLVIVGVVVAACNIPTGSGTAPSTGTPATPAASGDPPDFEAANMTASAAADSNGVYTIFGSLTYECDDDIVQTVQVDVPVLGKSYQYPANGQSDAYGWPFSFPLAPNGLLGPGDADYTLTLITKGGAQSTPMAETVTLQ
jgi:hypothetical protein